MGGQVQAFRDRLSAAFANAMACQHEPDLASGQAQLLTAPTFGIWLTARIDSAGAAQTCDATAARIFNPRQARMSEATVLRPARPALSAAADSPAGCPPRLGAVGTTPRHLSVVETGRSRPGRDLIFRIADALAVPLPERNSSSPE